MAYTFDGPNKTVTIPQSDCTLVSGTLYTLDTEVARGLMHGWMYSEEGIVFERIFDHNTEYTVAGVTYGRKIEIINGWQIEFSPDTSWSVNLTGSNNNLFDVGAGVLVQNNVQVIPGNSAGLVSIQGLDSIDTILDIVLEARAVTKTINQNNPPSI